MNEFEKLLQDNLAVLQRYVNFKINNRQDAEDIVQDVCLTATVKYGTLKKQDSFKSWLIGIANHKIKDHYRQNTRVSHIIPLEFLSEASLGVSRMGVSERNTVCDILDILGKKEKQILNLYYFKNLTQEEISRELRIPVGTVKSRLYYAKEKFKQHYPYRQETKGDVIMKKLPDKLSEYKIKAINEPEFIVIFEELPNWFIIPKTGESIKWASYDMPGRDKTEEVISRVVSKAYIHGIEGVEILTEFKNRDGQYSETTPHLYYAQLTDTHCRWLGESYVDKEGVRRMLTFLDGEDFMSDWGYGEDNCGSETNLKPKGIIKRNGDDIYISTDKNTIDVTGVFRVNINDKNYDTICVTEYFCNGALTEYYVDRNGRTVLWRRFNKNDWANKRYGKLWSEILPDNQRLTVNGEIYVHWYDCVSDYII